MPCHYIKKITHEEWLKERAKGVGSSEVGTIMGVNKYDTPYELWLRKTGRAPAKEMTEAMIMGHCIEDVVAQRFADLTGAQINDRSKGDWLAVDNTRDFLRVSPDRLYWWPGEKHTKRNYHIVECKTTGMNVDPDNPPIYWVLQLQYQMGVMGVKSGALAWISTAQVLHSGYKLYDFDKDLFENQIVPSLERFWNENILSDTAPTPRMEEELKLAYPDSDPETRITATEACLSSYERLKQLDTEIKAYQEKIDSLEKEKTEHKCVLKAEMKENELLVSPEGKLLATWKTSKDAEKFDSAAFKKENPDLYRKYVYTESGTRRFSIK